MFPVASLTAHLSKIETDIWYIQQTSCHNLMQSFRMDNERRAAQIIARAWLSYRDRQIFMVNTDEFPIKTITKI